MLQPLKVPGHCWQRVNMDLITKLPKTSSGNDSIFVVKDAFSKMVHIVPCRESMTAQEFAALFNREVFRLHGMPDQIVTDRGTQWTNAFWSEFEKLVGFRTTRSTAFHPRTNGAVEVVNSRIEDILRNYVPSSQEDWDRFLPCVEFAINSSYHSSIDTTPFFIVYGRYPMQPGLQSLPRSPCQSAQEFSDSWQTAL